MDDVLEEILKGKNTFEDIRATANKNDILRTQLIDSIKPVQRLLNDQTSRLSLDGKKFLTKRPDFRFQIDKTFHINLGLIYLYYLILYSFIVIYRQFIQLMILCNLLIYQHIYYKNMNHYNSLYNLTVKYVFIHFR